MKGMIWRALCYASPLYIITICCFIGLTLCAWIDTDAEMSIYEAIIIPLMLTLFFSFVPLSAIHSDISSGMLKWLMTSPMKASDYVRDKYVTVYFFIVIFLLLYISFTVGSAVFLSQASAQPNAKSVPLCVFLKRSSIYRAMISRSFANSVAMS